MYAVQLLQALHDLPICGIEALFADGPYTKDRYRRADIVLLCCASSVVFCNSYRHHLQIVSTSDAGKPQARALGRWRQGPMTLRRRTLFVAAIVAAVICKTASY